MRIKSLIAGTAMVLAFGVGSAIANDSVENTTIVPQLSDGFLMNVAPMSAAQLEAVRGMWWPLQNRSLGTRAEDIHNLIFPDALGGAVPRGLQ